MPAVDRALLKRWDDAVFGDDDGDACAFAPEAMIPRGVLEPAGTAPPRDPSWIIPW